MAITTEVNDHTHEYEAEDQETSIDNGHSHTILKTSEGVVFGFGQANGHTHGI